MFTAAEVPRRKRRGERGSDVSQEREEWRWIGRLGKK